MTPDEKQILTSLVDRVRATQLPHIDDEADQVIHDLARDKPQAAYILAQTVLMQDYALRQARTRLDDLQRQLDEARAAAARAPQRSGGFFSNLFGGGSAAPQSPQPGGPWGSRPAVGPGYAQPGYAPQQAYAPQPGYAPNYGVGGGAPSFLQGAAQTAVGVAGGALLFEGIESMFGGHGGYGGGFGGGGFGGGGFGGPQEVVNETVVNNYGDQPLDSTGYADTSYDSNAGGGFLDTGYDNGSDFGGDSDFGGNDDGYI